jgi:ABC-type transport system involved in cytochrome bd biosynthesis fused ATPase/permease subunit
MASWVFPATLERIDVEATSGELVAVLGRVGSGKASLLSLIAGEIHQSGDRVFVRGSASECLVSECWFFTLTSQSASVFSGS